MSGTSEMCEKVILTGSRNAISSPESLGGRTHCAWQDGRTIARSGLGVAHASHSAPPEHTAEQMTIDTFGQSFNASSRSEDLQSFLESRLRARLDADGSPEYVLVWKRWDMQSGPPICALRASARRTYASGSIGLAGWATPLSKDWKSGHANQLGINSRPLNEQATGLIPIGLIASMEKRDGYRLNHRFSLWLMGFPAEWASCGERAMLSFLR